MVVGTYSAAYGSGVSGMGLAKIMPTYSAGYGLESSCM